MDALTLAYLAGAMDSDGYFGIRKSTYAIRVRGDAANPVYSERVGLKQTTPQIPELLRESFGGTLAMNKPGTPNSKALHAWTATDGVAANACELLLPFLRVKRRQAELLLELRSTKGGGTWRAAYWFVKEYPEWQHMELVTYSEAATMLNMSVQSVPQAVGDGTLLAVPYQHRGTSAPRIPKLLIERLLTLKAKDGRSRLQAPELVAERDSLYEQVRGLNKIGIHGTPVYHRTGAFTQV